MNLTKLFGRPDIVATYRELEDRIQHAKQWHEIGEIEKAISDEMQPFVRAWPVMTSILKKTLQLHLERQERALLTKTLWRG